jgi:tetratricopeptide (TPR) repeat protein
VSAATDRLAVLMLAALSGEKKNPDAAINAYRLAIREAKEVHDLPLVVPAYLRLAEVLVNVNRTDEALALVQEFEERYPREGRTRPYDPTETQRGLMAIKKSRLKTASVGRRA